MKALARNGFWQAPAAGPATADRAEERRLIAAALDGDRRAREQVSRRVATSLYRFGRGFCRNVHDAEDVMQDALVSLFSSLEKFRGEASLSSWAYVVARNACARRRLRSARHEPLDVEQGGAKLEIRDTRAGPERHAEQRELHEAVERSIAALPDSLRHVLVLRDVEGLSAAAVGKQLGIGERAVKSRLHRARLLLREKLAPHLPVPPPPSGPGCAATARLFSEFLEGDLDARACVRLQEHVAGCASCTATCESLHVAVGECAACRDAPVPPEVREAVRAAVRESLRRVSTGRPGDRAPRRGRTASRARSTAPNRMRAGRG